MAVPRVRPWDANAAGIKGCHKCDSTKTRKQPEDFGHFLSMAIEEVIAKGCHSWLRSTMACSESICALDVSGNEADVDEAKSIGIRK